MPDLPELEEIDGNDHPANSRVLINENFAALRDAVNAAVDGSGDNEDVEGVKNFVDGIKIGDVDVPIPSAIVTRTGTQSISGAKDFTTPPTFNGHAVPVLTDGLLDPSVVPPVSKVTVQTVADQAAMLALANVQEGDVVAWADGTVWVATSGNTSLIGGWRQIDHPLVFGTGAGQYTEGNDARITGAVQKAGAGQTISSAIDHTGALTINGVAVSTTLDITTLLSDCTVIESVSNVYPAATRTEDVPVLWIGKTRPAVGTDRGQARPGDRWKHSKTAGGYRILTAAGRWSPRHSVYQAFSSDSPFNVPISTAATFEASSDAATAKLLSTTGVTRNVNWDNYSVPVFWASTTDNLYTVTSTITIGTTFKHSTPLQFYVPSNATPATPIGGDMTMTVITPDGKYAIDMFGTTVYHTAVTGPPAHAARTITCTSLRIVNLDSRGIGEARKAGIRAAGFSSLAGLIRDHELKEKYIPHALVVALANPQLKPSGYVWPASGEDADAGSTYSGGASAVGMGSFCAIPPSIDITTLGLTAEGLAMARAAQDYGVYVGDRAGSAMTFYVETGASNSTGAITNVRADINTIVSQLRICTNSGSNAVGGPGTSRRVPAVPTLVKMHPSPEDSPEGVAVFEDTFSTTSDERGVALTSYWNPFKWYQANNADVGPLAPTPTDHKAFVDVNGGSLRVPSGANSSRLFYRVSPLGQFGTDYDITMEGIRSNNVTTTGAGFAISLNGDGSFPSANWYQNNCYYAGINFVTGVVFIRKVTGTTTFTNLGDITIAPIPILSDVHNLRVRKQGALFTVWYRRNQGDWSQVSSQTLAASLHAGKDIGFQAVIGSNSAGIDVTLDRIRIADLTAPMTEELTPVAGKLATDKNTLVVNSVQKDETVIDLGNSSTALTIPSPLVSGTGYLVNVNANCTITLPPAVKGRNFSVQYTNAGSYTLTHPANTKAAGGSIPGLTAGAGKVDEFTYRCWDGVNYNVSATADMR